MSIHLCCAPDDEVDCEYAADLIPLFGEAGWDVANTVDRITLGRPKPEIPYWAARHGKTRGRAETEVECGRMDAFYRSILKYTKAEV